MSDRVNELIVFLKDDIPLEPDFMCIGFKEEDKKYLFKISRIKEKDYILEEC